MGSHAAALLAHAGADRVPRRASLHRDGKAAAPPGSRGARAFRERNAVAPAEELAILPLGEALERLASPDAIELYSPLSGAGLLVADFGRSAAGLEPGAVEAACAALARLPCPSLALAGERPEPALERLLARFDVVASSREELVPIAASARLAPLAAQALVQLLRLGAGLGIHDALVAESLAYSMLQSGPEFARWRAGRTLRPAPPETGEPAVRVRRSGDRLHLQLNRPERRNAFSAAMRDALVEGLQLAELDASIEEVILSGVGPAFCSGGDLDEFGSRPDPATAHAVRSSRSAAALIARSAARVRAELHGACVGAGIELPAFASRVVAREGAFFQLPELSLGLVPGAGGTVSLPRRIGRERTAWLALSGARIDAPTARRWGLIDEICP